MNSQRQETTSQENGLKDLVIRHQICWEVWPIYGYSPDRTRLQVGFEVDLVGTHDHPAHPLSAGCEECLHVFRVLHNIATWIMPAAGHDSDHTILSFDRGLHHSPKRHNRADVELQIQIHHRTGYLQPIEPSQVSCLQTIEQRLAALGACKGQWRHGESG